MAPYKTSVNRNNNNNGIDLNDLFRKMIFHWPLYLIILLLGMVGAMLYLKYKQPVYMSVARLYLKDEKKSGEEMDILKSLSLFGNGKNMENEMEVLQSPVLLQRVISDGHFNIRYFEEENVRNIELYDKSPLVLRALGDSANVGNYRMEIIPDGEQLQVRASGGSLKTPVELNVREEQPFTLGKDDFVINLKPNSGGQLAHPVRVRVDSIQEISYKVIDNISTSLVNRDATVVLITYKDVLASRSADFLNAILEEYNNYTLNDKNKAAIKTITFLSSRIDSLKTELGTLEKAEETFKVQRGITDIDASSKLALEQIKEADTRLSEANMQLSVLNQVEHYVNNPGSGSPVAPVAGSVDQTLTAMVNRYEEGLKEQRRLSLSLQPSSAIMRNLDAQINDARRTIRDYIAGYRRNAGIVQKKTQDKLGQIQGKIANIPAYAREYINIKRQQGVKENLYLYLLKKKEEAAVSYASNVTDNKVIAPAFVPDKPIAPKKPLVIAGFLAVAFVITSIYIYIKYFLNPRVLDRKEIERLSGSPVIAEIYQHSEGLKDFSLNNRHVLTEQVFNLRTNLKFLLAEHKGPAVVMLTSCLSGEGKTFLSAHLANSLTVSGKKVVMIDMDLRRPKLARFFGLDYTSGITSYVVGNQTIEEIIHKVPGTDGLHLIPSGPIPPNPIEMIESNGMATLLSYLKERFDYIIVDTSPVGIVSDAKSIASYADCTLFVVRYNFTLRSKLATVLENMKDSNFRKRGIVFNGVEQYTFYPYYYYDQYAYREHHSRKHVWIAFLKKTISRIA